MGINGVSTEPAPEPEKEEKKVSSRQKALDHVFIGLAGLLIVVSGSLFFLRARKRRGGAKGIFGGDGYAMVGQRAA